MLINPHGPSAWEAPIVELNHYCGALGSFRPAKPFSGSTRIQCDANDKEIIRRHPSAFDDKGIAPSRGCKPPTPFVRRKAKIGIYTERSQGNDGDEQGVTARLGTGANFTQVLGPRALQKDMEALAVRLRLL